MFYRILILFLCACSAAPSDGNPFELHELDSSERQWREGRVIERVAAGPYTYLLLRESSGRAEWLVSLRSLTPIESHVRALVIGRAARFQSRRLGREFSPLLFAAVRRTAESSSNNLTLEIAP